MAAPDSRKDFVERHGLSSKGAEEAGRRILKQVEERGIEVVRCVFVDQHGIGPLGSCPRDR